MIGLSCAWRWIWVSITSGAPSVKKPPPLTGGSWNGSPSTRIGLPNERRSRAELRVDHRTFVDHDEPGLGGRPVGVEGEGRRAFRALARPVDERVDGRRAGAALRAHHQRRLAGEGGERRLAARAFGDVAGERRLADAGIAEQAEHLGLALLEPPADLVDRRPPARATIRGRSGATAGRRRGGLAASARRLLAGACAPASSPARFGSALAPQREQTGGLRPRS